MSVATLTLGAAGCGVGNPESAQEELVDEAASALASTCVTIQRGTSGAVEDSLLASDSPAKVHGASAAVSMGIAASGGTREALVKWSTSGIPAGSLVTSATATFTTALYSGGPLEIHQAKAPWSEATVSWGSFNQAFDPTVVATMTGAAGANTADLTSLAQGWVDGSTNNNGVLITRAGSSVTNFNSSEAATVAQRPSLQICYVTNPCSANPCQNGGTCTPGAAGAYTCGCAVGFSGPTCQTSACAGVVCSATDACHAAGVCNPATGQCDLGSSLGDTASGLGHRWTFDEPSGPTALDSAGASNGALGSSASRVTSFDGSGAILLTPTKACDLNAEVDFGNAPGAFGTSDFTVSFWVATNFSGTGAGDLIGNRIDGSGGNFLSARVRASDGLASLELDADPSGTNYTALTSTPSGLNDAKWHNLTYTRTGVTLTTYLDGVAMETGSSVSPIDVLGDHPFKIGRALPFCLSGFKSISAIFDDVRIYTRALGACDVSLLAATYPGTPAGFPPPPPPSPPACPCSGNPIWEHAISAPGLDCDSYYGSYDFSFDGGDGYAGAYDSPVFGTGCFAYDDATGTSIDLSDISTADADLCVAQIRALACP